MSSSHLILSCSVQHLHSIFPSIRDFSSESVVLMRWPIYWSFSFSFRISISNKYSGFISLKIDWFDLLAVQGTFRSLLQHHSLKASIVWCSVQLSGPYVTTGKTIALITRAFVARVMSLLFNKLSRFVIAFLLSRSNQSPSTVKEERKKRKYVTASTFSPSNYHEVMELMLWS